MAARLDIANELLDEAQRRLRFARLPRLTQRCLALVEEELTGARHGKA